MTTLLALALLQTTNPAIEPVDRRGFKSATMGWNDDSAWIGQHKIIKGFKEKSKAQVVLLGDSIFQGFGGPGRDLYAPGSAAWDKHLSAIPRFNAAIGADSTQHIIWRVQDGALNKARPRVVLILAGTNNLPHQTPVQTAEGIWAVVRSVQKSIGTRSFCLVSMILPRGEKSTDEIRGLVNQTNELLKQKEDSRAAVINPGSALLNESGEWKPGVAAKDYVHLTPAGYDAFAQELAKILPKFVD